MNKNSYLPTDCLYCKEKGFPPEGMTKQCEYCGGIYCFGHSLPRSHSCTYRIKHSPIKEGDKVYFAPWNMGVQQKDKSYEGVVVSISAPSIGFDRMVVIEAYGQRYERLESDIEL